MFSDQLKPSKQDILLATVHNLEDVTEVYLNKNQNFILELIHHKDGRMAIYEYEFNNYIMQSGNLKSLDNQIAELLSTN